jgi:hypothetical protein
MEGSKRVGTSDRLAQHSTQQGRLWANRDAYLDRPSVRLYNVLRNPSARRTSADTAVKGKYSGLDRPARRCRDNSQERKISAQVAKVITGKSKYFRRPLSGDRELNKKEKGKTHVTTALTDASDVPRVRAAGRLVSLGLSDWKCSTTSEERVNITNLRPKRVQLVLETSHWLLGVVSQYFDWQLNSRDPTSRQYSYNNKQRIGGPRRGGDARKSGVALRTQTRMTFHSAHVALSTYSLCTSTTSSMKCN